MSTVHSVLSLYNSKNWRQLRFKWIHRASQHTDLRSVAAKLFSHCEMAPTSVIVEYAKSGRSACKVCHDAIPAKAVRMGLVTRDPVRGYTSTNWHHLDCFDSFDGFTPSSIKSISGFDSLQIKDQESLTNLVSQRNQTDSKKRKKEKDETQVEAERTELKTIKLSTESEEVKMVISHFEIGEKYKEAILPPGWKAYQTVIFHDQSDGLHSSDKIAAFDFDGCLANTSVKRHGADAWSLMYPSIPTKMQTLYNDGYKLVIFTNESNIARWKNKRQSAVDSKIGRLTNFIKLVNVPMQVFIACGSSVGKVEDLYRKPNTGMWQIMEKHFNSGISIDMDKSFYVGDAAGRKGDHSDADIQFAKKIGLKFYVPEDYFL